jgi:hypothetical protein
MATNTVDQSRLVLNAFAAIFQNNLLARTLLLGSSLTEK